MEKAVTNIPLNFTSTEKIIQVASTLAIEEMYIENDIITNLQAVANKEKTIEDCIRELDEIYGG